MGNRLKSALSERLQRAGLQAQVVGDAPMFDTVFAGGEIRNYRDTLRADKAQMSRLNALLLARGILKGENKYYLSVILDEDDITQTIDAWDDAIGEMTA